MEWSGVESSGTSWSNSGHGVEWSGVEWRSGLVEGGVESSGVGWSGWELSQVVHLGPIPDLEWSGVECSRVEWC